MNQDDQQDEKQLRKKIQDYKKSVQAAQVALKKQQQQKKKKQEQERKLKQKEQKQKMQQKQKEKQKQMRTSNIASSQQKQKQKKPQQQQQRRQQQKKKQQKPLKEKEAVEESQKENESPQKNQDQEKEKEATITAESEEDKAVKKPDEYISEQLTNLGPTFTRSEAIENKLAAMTTLDRLSYIDSVVDVYLKEKASYLKSYQAQQQTPISKKTFYDFLKDVVTNLLNAKCTPDEWRTSLAKKKSGIQEQQEQPQQLVEEPEPEGVPFLQQQQQQPSSLYPIGLPSQTAAPALQSLFQKQNQQPMSPLFNQQHQNLPYSPLVQEIVQKEKEKYINEDVLAKIRSERAKKKYRKGLTNDERKLFNNFYQNIMLATKKTYISYEDIIQFKQKYANALVKIYEQKQKKQQKRQQ
jgi:hypothetical protein